MSDANLPDPIFKTDGMFVLVLKRLLKTEPIPALKISEKTSEKTREKTREKITNLIAENNEITIEELPKILGRSTRAIEMQLKSLKSENRIERIGPNKGGYWKINK
jgi:ATP-dependent DNA helicase RecG